MSISKQKPPNRAMTDTTKIDDAAQQLQGKRTFSPAALFLSWEMILLYLLLAVTVLVMALRPNLYFERGIIPSMIQAGMDMSFMSLGMYVLLGQGDRDISIGGLLLLVSMVIGLAYGQGIPTAVCLILGLLTALCGQLISGFLVAVLDLSAVIVAISMAAVYRGIVKIVLGINTLSTYPTWFSAASWGNVLGGMVPISLLVFFFCAVLFYLLIHKTKLGRQMEIIGVNKTTALYSGINVTRVRIYGYLIMGVMVTISSIFFVGRLGNGVIASAGLGYELEVMVIANLGLVKVGRRRPTVVGIVLATILMTCLNYALSLLGIQTNIRKIATGLILIISVAVSQCKSGSLRRLKTR